MKTDIYLSCAELAAAAEISPARVMRLVRLGVVEPEAETPPTFTAATACRLRRMLRLHDDLRVNFVGVAIIVDLLERIERQDQELARLREDAARENAWTRTG